MVSIVKRKEVCIKVKCIHLSKGHRERLFRRRLFLFVKLECGISQFEQFVWIKVLSKKEN